MKTLKTNKAIALLTLLMLALSSFNSIAQEVKKELQTESDGFQWYKLRQTQNGQWKYGAQSVGGVTFIPLSRGYTFVCYHDTEGGWFRVDKGEKENGVCDITGKEIIAPGRYDEAYYRNKDGFEYCSVELNGKEGICDRNGREIIAPKYNSVIYYDNHFSCDDGYYTKEGRPENAIASSSTTSSSSSVSSSSSSSSNSSAKEEGLLYKGDYTIGPEVYPDGSSYPSPFGDSEYIEIYTDAIDMGTRGYEFKTITNNGTRKYGEAYEYVLVYKNYNIKKFTSVGNLGFITQEFTKKGSSSTTPQNQDGNYGGGGTGTYNGGNSGSSSTSNSGGYNQPSGPKTKDCPHCHHSGKCNSCNGRGWIYAIGSSDHLDCPNCKHGECQWCNGTGSVTTH